jgi:ATP-binding cassette, subfamily F, member 3
VWQGVPEQKLRAHLGSFGVSGSLALQSMYTLSGRNRSDRAKGLISV